MGRDVLSSARLQLFMLINFNDLTFLVNLSLRGKCHRVSPNAKQQKVTPPEQDTKVHRMRNSGASHTFVTNKTRDHSTLDTSLLG